MRTKKETKEHFSKIMRSAPLDEPLSEHHGELLGLLSQHPAADEKIGAGVSHFKVGLVKPYNDRGYFIVRADGSEVGFSYVKCISGRKPRSFEIKKAFRNEVFHQVAEFKRAVVVDGARCSVTGDALVFETAEVDHAPPCTFAQLLAEFARAASIDLTAVKTATSDGGVTFSLVDRQLAASWRQFHQDNAKLRALSPEGHKRTHANDNRKKKRAA